MSGTPWNHSEISRENTSEIPGGITSRTSGAIAVGILSKILADMKHRSSSRRFFLKKSMEELFKGFQNKSQEVCHDKHHQKHPSSKRNFLRAA